MADRSVIVRLGMEVAGYQSSAAKAAASTAAIGKEAQKAAQIQAAASAKAVSEVKKLGVATLGVAAAIGYGMAKAVGAASDLYETINKSNVVFGTAASSVQKWGKTAATSMGMSENSAISYAATLGNLFVSMGQSKEAAAGMSMQMVQLASDLASFNNTSPEDALEAIRAGLVGEVEPLRRYGVALQDATLKQEAMNLGYTWQGQVLPPLIRQQAAYSLILKQTGTAQGDFARTSDGLANQQRILSAQVEDLSANLGEGLYPVVTKMVTGLNDMLEIFNELPTPVQATAVGVVALGGATLILAPRVAATVKAVRNLSTAMGGGGLLGNLKSTAAFMVGPWGVALVAGTGLLISLANQAAKTKANVEAMEEVLKGAADANETYLEILDKGPAIAERFAGGLNVFQSVRSVTEILADMGVTIDQIGSHLNDNKQGWDNYANGLVNAARAAGANGGEIVLLQDRLGDLYRASNDARSAVDAEGKVMGPAAAAARDLAQANKESADAAKAVTDAINAQISAVMAAANADLAAMDAQDNWKASLKDSAATLRDKEKAALEAATAVGQAAAKEAEAAGAADGAAAGNAAMRAEFEKMRAQIAPGSPLYVYLTGLIAKLDAAAVDRTMTFTTVYKSTGNPAVGMTASTYNQQVPKQARGATGGVVTQDGIHHYAAGGSVDTVPAMLAPGEFVLQASAAKALGLTFLQMLNDSGSTTQAATAVGAQVGDAMTTGVAKGVSESHKKVIDQATALFAELQSKARDMAKQVADTVAGSFGDFELPEHGPVETWYADAAGNITKSYDAGGKGTPLENQQAKAAGMSDFAKQVGQLAKAGLNNSNLQDIISMGWQKGGEVAAGILADAGSIKALNSAQGQIDAAAKAIGGVAAQSEYGKAMVTEQQKMVKILSTGVKLAGSDLAYLASIVGSAVARASVKKAGGGLVHGPGSGTSDDVPILASSGEYVVKASAVRRIGVDVLDRINRGRPILAYAGGGVVSRAPAADAEWRPGASSGRDADYLAQRIGFYLGQALNGSAVTRQLRVATQTGMVR